MKHVRRALAGVITLTAIGVGLGVGSLRAKRVTGVAVVRGAALDAIYATGTVEARVRTRIRARSSGELVSVSVGEGEFVERGQVLARLDAARASSLVERERASLSEARVQASNASPALATLASRRAASASELTREQAELERVQKLYDSGSVSESELNIAQRRVEVLQKRVEELDFQTRATELQLRTAAKRQASEVDVVEAMAADLVVRAPVDGIVLQRPAEMGEYVLAGEVLFVVGSRPPYVVEVQVSEEDVTRISADEAHTREPTRVIARIRGLDAERFEGRVVRVGFDADRQKGTFVVQAELDDPPPALRSGMGCELNLITQERSDALLVASAGVVGDAVWVAREGRARRVPVRVGIRGPAWVSIDSGVALGDVVLVSDVPALKEGERVDVHLEMLPEPPRPDAASARQER